MNQEGSGLCRRGIVARRIMSGAAALAAMCGLPAGCSISVGAHVPDAGSGTQAQDQDGATQSVATADGGACDPSPPSCVPLGQTCPGSFACCQTGAGMPVGAGCTAATGTCVPRCNSAADCPAGSCCVHNSSSVPPSGAPPVEPGGWCFTGDVVAANGFSCMSGYGNDYVCEGTYTCGYRCAPAGDGGAAAGAEADGASSSSDSSGSGEAGPPEGGGADARAGCAANVTIKNVAFYGQGTAVQPTVCTGIAPASAAVTGNVEAMVNGTVIYGSAPTAWFAYAAASTGQAKPAVTFDTAAAAFSATVPVVAAADGSYSFGAVGLAFVETAASPGTCANASGYAGVSFDIEGDFGGCKATFNVTTSEDDPTGTGGTCTASTCYSPSVAITQTGTVMVPFTSLAGGMPQGTVDPSAITGVQWQFTP